jgi:hypothetical protein
MNKQIIEKVSRDVYKNFPELSGSPPQVSMPKTPGPDATYILTYKGNATQPDGKRIPRSVRVVANAQGKILRMSTSR